MELGQNNADFYQNIETGNLSSLTNKSENFMLTPAPKESKCSEQTNPYQPQNTPQEKRRPIVFRQDPRTLEFVPSGISESPRSTPEPVEPEILSLAHFAFDDDSPELLLCSEKVINSNSEESERVEEEFKVKGGEKSTKGGKFEGLAEEDVYSLLSRYSTSRSNKLTKVTVNNSPGIIALVPE